MPFCFAYRYGQLLEPEGGCPGMLLSQLSCKYWHSSLAMIALPQERDFIGEMTKLVEDLADPKASSPNSKMYFFFIYNI